MNIFELEKTIDLPSVPIPSDDEFTTRYVRTRKPILLDRVAERLKFVANWSLDYFAQRLQTIRVQQPSTDGVYHYLGFERVPYEDFSRGLTTQENRYALEPLIGFGAPQGSKKDRSVDFDESAVPTFIPSGKLRVSNLYIGPGSNKSLLHFDEVHGLLIMVEGQKRFSLFPPDQTKNMYPYSVFNLKSVAQHRVLDSKVNADNLDFRRFPRIRNAKGWHGVIKPGQALFIPAGTWHYIESDDLNVAVNYFWHQSKFTDWLNRPLLEFWIKRREVLLIDIARKLLR